MTVTAMVLPYEAALDMEIELAIHLREKGYGVWQG